MENLRHFSANNAKMQSVFFNSPLTEEMNQFYHQSINNNNSEKIKDEMSSGLSELHQIYADCTAYVEDLMYLCHSGLRVANGLAFLDPNPTDKHEMAGHFVKIWNQLAITTKKLVSELEDGPMVGIREVLASDKKDKSLSENKKLLTACFVAILQIHFQFSFSMFDSVVQLFSSLPKEPFSSPVKTSKSSSHDPVDVSTHLMSSWLESMTEMQKYLTNSLSNINQIKYGGDCPNQPTDYRSNQHSRRRWSFGGLRQSVSSNDWSSKQWGHCDVDNIWCHDAQHGDEHLKPSTPETKINVSGSEKLGTFASNEELQDVISLLSCQPSNPSSPTSEIQHSLTSSTNGAQNLLWSSSTSRPTSFSVTSTENNSLTPDVDDFSSWNKSDDQPYGDLSLGLPPKLFDLTSITVEESEIQHAKVKKTASCPPTKSSQRQNDDGNNSGNGSQQNGVGHASGARAKEQGFFLGLELVGTDLMASVRQRRHSSGESLCKNSRINSPTSSGRTKSIDNIMSDGKCARTSTWPLKQISPQSSVFYIQNNDWKTTNQQQITSSNWSSLPECPLGLPPSGIECRNKSKIERKYSLFGNPT